MAADEKLGKDYWPLFSLMRRAAAAPLLAFPGNDDEGSLEVLFTTLLPSSSSQGLAFLARPISPGGPPDSCTIRASAQGSRVKELFMPVHSFLIYLHSFCHALCLKVSSVSMSTQGLNEVTVAEARKTATSLVAELNTPNYKPLHTLLSNRRSMNVVEAACAMAIIVQPFDRP